MGKNNSLINNLYKLFKHLFTILLRAAWGRWFIQNPALLRIWVRAISSLVKDMLAAGRNVFLNPKLFPII